MLHTVLIYLHAAAGVIAFATGVGAIRRTRLLPAYRWSLAAMASFLLLAVIVTATGRGAVNWTITAALLALAGVMVARSTLAARVPHRTVAYVYHIGFGLIGLFDAFWVVAVLRAGGPPWTVAAVAVGIAAAGHFLLVWTARRVTRSATAPAPVGSDGSPARP